MTTNLPLTKISYSCFKRLKPRSDGSKVSSLAFVSFKQKDTRPQEVETFLNFRFPPLLLTLCFQMSNTELLDVHGTNLRKLRDLKPVTLIQLLIVDASETPIKGLACNSEIGNRIVTLNARSCSLTSLIGLSSMKNLVELNVGDNQLKVNVHRSTISIMFRAFHLNARIVVLHHCNDFWPTTMKSPTTIRPFSVLYHFLDFPCWFTWICQTTT